MCNTLPVACGSGGAILFTVIVMGWCEPTVTRRAHAWVDVHSMVVLFLESTFVSQYLHRARALEQYTSVRPTTSPTQAGSPGECARPLVDRRA